MEFVRFEKAYPCYFAYTKEGKRAHIEVHPNKEVVIYGISGRRVKPDGKYAEAFSKNLVMNTLATYANTKSERHWGYYLYVDSCISAGIVPLPYWEFGEFSNLGINTSILVKLTKEYKRKTAPMYKRAVEIMLHKANVSKADADFISLFKREPKVFSFLLKNPMMIPSVRKWFDTPAATVLGQYKMRSVLECYVNTLAEIGDNWSRTVKDDFWETILAAENELLALKCKVFIENQMRRALAYENDTFAVIVPTTYNELKVEGERLHNCLAGIEWDSYLTTGERHVVFIRRKSNLKKSYIACDISAKDGKIRQYLTACNKRPQEEDAREFAKEYQKYLRGLWKES